jgi:hypothetical protein
LARQLAIFLNSTWTDWLPTYAWAIEDHGGAILVYTGQGRHLFDSGKSLHPYIRWEVKFQIERETEIGPRIDIRSGSLCRSARLDLASR